MDTANFGAVGLSYSPTNHASLEKALNDSVPNLPTADVVKTVSACPDTKSHTNAIKG